MHWKTVSLILDGGGSREDYFIFSFWAYFLCHTSLQEKTTKFPLCFQFYIKEFILAKQSYSRTEFKTILGARILQKILSVIGSLELLRHGAAMKEQLSSMPPFGHRPLEFSILAAGSYLFQKSPVCSWIFEVSMWQCRATGNWLRISIFRVKATVYCFLVFRATTRHERRGP